MTTKNESQMRPISTTACNLSRLKSIAVCLLSYFIITFGQPVYSSFCALLTATIGYALFFSQIIDLPLRARAIQSFLFFFMVQGVQLFWFTYHPVSAVISAYLLLCFLLALQFGFLAFFVTTKQLSTVRGMLSLPAVWMLLEWSRIYWCSGFYFNLAGISLTSNVLSLQTASLFGVLGMSFWVILTNVSILRAYLWPTTAKALCALLIFLLPYLFGTWHLNYHEKEQAAYDLEHPPIKALIIHSKNVPEEFKKERTKTFSPQERALKAWNEITQAISPFYGQVFDLILFPEGVIPYGSTSLLFTANDAQTLIRNSLSKSTSYSVFPASLRYTPTPTTEPAFCSEDIAQTISSLYKSPLIIGLEGIERTSGTSRPNYYNSAFLFTPHSRVEPLRYDKQVLVPMGEYIPLEWAKTIAAKYGVYDSFTPGKKAQLFDTGRHKIGVSICYEETVGSLMRQNTTLGASLLVNLTDDYWFPYSLLARQHYEHARPRTLENGIPLIRSCNFGISGAIDSLGRTTVAKEGPEQPSAFVATVSSYHYPTLYGQFGDLPLLLLSVALILVVLLKKKQKLFPFIHNLFLL